MKSKSRATWTHDLSQSERRFLVAMNDLWFGRFESLHIERGELVLDPWPTGVRVVKFQWRGATARAQLPSDFELKPAVAALFAYIRAAGEGEILYLEVRHGLPFSMEIIYRPDISRGRHGRAGF